MSIIATVSSVTPFNTLSNAIFLAENWFFLHAIANSANV